VTYILIIARIPLKQSLEWRDGCGHAKASNSLGGGTLVTPPSLAPHVEQKYHHSSQLFLPAPLEPQDASKRSCIILVSLVLVYLVLVKFLVRLLLPTLDCFEAP
jgi:hypothetical protein